MLQIALLVVFAIWLSAPVSPPAGDLSPAAGAAVMVVGFGAIVLSVAIWSRLLRNVPIRDLQKRMARYTWITLLARAAIPAWFATSLFVFGWKGLVEGWLAPVHLDGDAIYTPGILIGSLPPMAALMGLIWAQFPVDQSLREQSILVQLNEDLPFAPTPQFWPYFFAKLRMGILFTLAPAGALVVLHDLCWLAINPILSRWQSISIHPSAIDAAASIPAAVAIAILAPEILRRVLQTERMADSPLRRRLEAIGAKYRIAFKDVLLWRTSYQMGNAAVMGFVRQTRYVLLSDLLVETMTDEQIEAVFAHELGHVVHRHLIWLAATGMGLVFLLSGPGVEVAYRLSHRLPHLPETVQWAVWGALGLAIFAAVFGYISRKFERQADVFAARTVQGIHVPQAVAPSSVGEQGAEVFCAALRRVAAVNHIPVAAASWSHGSIQRRMRFLAELGHDPQGTASFDRFMKLLYLGLIMGLCLTIVLTAALVGSGSS